MGRVQTLPEEVINHIAAGEVVERPASVVKELLENALDAQARTITVTVQAGGTALIRVDDDGIGMDAEDAVHCFTRHATSKIRDWSDLGRLGTMGFRGEALPSIAAVSRVELISRCSQEVEATRVVMEGGRITEVEASGAPPGTSVRVRDLFYNTPARLKFLKNPTTEASHIAHCFSSLALVARDVHMSLYMNGRLHTQALPAAALGERIDMVCASGLQEHLLEVSDADAELQIYGCIANATFHRATRRQQFFFVNGRPVQNRTLSSALYEAYRSLLPRNRHPVAFLFLRLPPETVDVNVHPAKLEVRFRQESRLYDRVRRLLQRRLRDRVEAPAAACAAAAAASLPPAGFEATVPMLWRPAPSIDSGSPECRRPLSPPRAASGREPGLHAGYPEAGRPILEGDAVGQLHDTYILLQYPDGVCLVDQHAAHERVVYERLVARFADGPGEAQQLLFPLSLDLEGVEPQWLEACVPRLATLGFRLEPFGGSTYRLHSVPAVLAERDYAAALMDVLEVLRTPGADDPSMASTESIPQVWDRLLTVMACHGAIRAHQRLQEAEIRALLQDLARTARPFTCPHGRPVVLHLALSEIERKFLRR